MAAIVFDPLEFTHELEASGVPREQAEVHAKAMTARFLHNFDALVTRDYLDTRFTEFETRVEATMDGRFGEVDKRFTGMQVTMDGRFAEVQVNMDRRFGEVDNRFTEMEANMDRRFGEVDKNFTEMGTNTDSKFTEMESSLDKQFAEVDVRFERAEGRFLLMYWMQGLTIACVVIPAIRDFLA
jgi:hypothetical protein